MIDDRSIDLRLKEKTFESSDNYLAVEVYRNTMYYLWHGTVDKRLKLLHIILTRWRYSKYDSMELIKSRYSSINFVGVCNFLDRVQSSNFS